MRHLGTLITAIIVAPLVWILLALGEARSTAAFTGDHQANEFVTPLLLLAVSGLILGLFGTLRFSPLGALVIGVIYTFISAMLLVKPATVVHVFIDDFYVAGHRIDLAAPIRTGTTTVLGVLLLVGTVSVRRWRRRPASAVTAPAEKERDQDRLVGTDGLGLTSSYEDTLKDLNKESDTERYTTSSASNSTYGW